MPTARLPLVILPVAVPPVPVAVPVALPPVPVVVAVTLPPEVVVALPLPLLEDPTPLPAVIIVVVPEGCSSNAAKVVIDVADEDPAIPWDPGPIAVVPPAVVVVSHG